MKHLSCTFDEFARKIKKEDSSIVVYGAGAIGTLLAPFIFDKYKIEDNVKCYVDGDKLKQGKNVYLYNSEKKIVSIDEIRSLKNIVLVITNSTYSDVVRFLNGLSFLENVEYVILPEMQSLISDAESYDKIIRNDGERKIPKIIHYCWFGKNEMPSDLVECINSWKKYCPDYEFKLWNEDNYDISKYPYMQQAYDAGKLGFVPDILRLELLYQYGGVYLDTDVELIRPLDEMLYQDGFCCVEKWGYINIGSGAGCTPGNRIIKELLDFRKNESFIREDGSLNLTTCGYYETMPLIKKGFRLDNTLQTIGDMNIYPADFFCPFNYMNKKLTISDNTIGIHRFNNSWK